MSNPTKQGMDWIKIETSLLGHPKLEDLIAYIREKDPEAARPSIRRDIIGSLATLWLKAGKYFSDGEVHDTQDPIKRLANLCEWHGDPQVWAEGLSYVRFVEKAEPNGFFIHDWHHFTEKWILSQAHKEKQKDDASRRAAEYRARMKAAAAELKFLKEQAGEPYDARPQALRKSPHPVTQKSRDERVTSRDERARNMTSQNVEKIEDSPLSEISKTDQSKHSPPQPDNERFMEYPSDSSTFPRHAPVTRDETLRHVTNAHERQEKRREEKNKDKDGTLEKDSRVPALVSSASNQNTAPQEDLANAFKGKLEARLGRPVLGHGFRPSYLAAQFSQLLKQVPPEEIERRVDNWFKTDCEFVTTANWKFSLFLRWFDDLSDGPLKNYAKETDDGGMDKPRDLETRDDF